MMRYGWDVKGGVSRRRGSSGDATEGRVGGCCVEGGFRWITSYLLSGEDSRRRERRREEVYCDE